MWGLHTANEDHWVPIATVASFKRMKPFASFGIPWLANALKESSELLEVDEKLENCRRKTEPKEISQNDLLDRSIYAVCVPPFFPLFIAEVTDARGWK